MPLARHDVEDVSGNLPFEFLLTCLLRGMTMAHVDDGEKYYMFLLTCLLRGMTINGETLLTELTFLLTCLLRGMT